MLVTATVFADINECADSTDNCHADALCHNTEGNYTCTCNPGYKGNGALCTGKLKQLLVVAS